MNAWIFSIESTSGVAGGTDDLEGFAEALDGDARTFGAAASVNVASGVISATFTIGAADAVEAAELGVQAFRDALGASGLAPGERTAITVELVPIANTVHA